LHRKFLLKSETDPLNLSQPSDIFEHMFARYEQEMNEWFGSPPETAPEDLISELDVVMDRINRSEARAAELLGQVAKTGAFRRDGYSSPTALLKHRYSRTGSASLQMVIRANNLPSTPRVAAAYEAGDLSSAQVDLLLSASASASEPFDSDQKGLIEMAIGTPLVSQLRKSLDYWVKEVAKDSQESQRADVRSTRALRVRRDLEMIHVSAWYDIESGEQILAALDPGPPAVDDDRSTPMRRADLLLDIINGSQDRPNLVVHVGYGEMLRAKAGISETQRGNFLTGSEIDRISCEAAVNRVVFDPKGYPLDVGRTKRLVTKGQRIALEARDLGCVFPGCDRPAKWCDAHHLIHWKDCGPTTLSNLVLLCRHHHNLIHDVGWTIKGVPGDLSFYRPDGTLLGEIVAVEPDPDPDLDPSSDYAPFSNPYERLAAFQAINREFRHRGRDDPGD
jgi:hypothetical protein